MSEAAGPDSAWVSVETPLRPQALLPLARDAERLLRINSALIFEVWRRDGPGRYFMRVRNLSNGQTLETALAVEELPDGCRIAYERGLKATTTVRAEARPGGSRLTITDDYGALPAAERERRLDEVDRSLASWGGDLRRYFRQWARWGWLAPWRWYMERAWQPMKPAARRVAFLLIATTAIEFVVFLVLVAILWLETAG
jgi:hypothetical protein